MKKNKKITVLITIIMIIISISSIVFGGFSNQLNANTQLTGTTTVSNKLNDVIGIVQVIGVGIAIIMLLWLAIKFMTASVQEKAEIKKHLMVYVVGAVFLFGSSALLQILKSFTEESIK